MNSSELKRECVERAVVFFILNMSDYPLLLPRPVFFVGFFFKQLCLLNTARWFTGVGPQEK